MENGKSPGIEHLPTEFYKSQYKLIENDLLQHYNSILFLNENLMIRIIKKELLKNWRPISILCIDSNNLTKMISNR